MNQRDTWYPAPRLRLIQQEDQNAGMDSDVQRHLNLPIMREETLPQKTNFLRHRKLAERESTQETDDFWSMSDDFIYSQHVAPRGQLHVPRESSLSIPLEHIDVIRQTKQIWTLWRRAVWTTIGTQNSFGRLDTFR